MKSKSEWLNYLATLQLPNTAYIAGPPLTHAETYTVSNPATGAVLVEMIACSTEHVDQAVRYARKTFQDGDWADKAPRERKAILKKLAQLIRDHREELALLESINVGKPIQDALNVDIPSSANILEWYAESIDKIYDEIAPTASTQLAMVTREAIGVVAAVVPWNFPLDLAIWKLGPALAMGNSVILKPAEQSPFSALRLAELACEAGIPDGVLQVLPGLGQITGRALGLHADIDCLTFTGSTETAKKFLAYSAQSNLKPIWPETGGKSANIIFADADLDTAVEKSIFGAFYNQGQVCSANSRIIIEHSIFEIFLAKLIEKTNEIQVGDPLDTQTTMGCLINPQHAETVRQYIENAKSEGAIHVETKALNIDEALDSSSFVPPTILINVTSDMQIFQEEVFGPVLCISTFRDTEQAVKLANDSIYGLAASIWTQNINKALKISKRLRVGTVSINTVDALDVCTPFGGYKQSGYGRDLSLHAIDKFTQLKTTWIAL